jgi:hypothetical protein
MLSQVTAPVLAETRGSSVRHNEVSDVRYLIVVGRVGRPDEGKDDVEKRRRRTEVNNGRQMMLDQLSNICQWLRA